MNFSATALDLNCMFAPTTNILLVDDMKGVRLLIAKELKELGFTKILEAENGHEGFSILKSSLATPQPIQLVISDLKMPKMDGLEFLRLTRANKETAAIPFIILTAESEKENVVRAIQLGVSDYMIKPMTAPILSKKLELVWDYHFGKNPKSLNTAG